MIIRIKIYCILTLQSMITCESLKPFIIIQHCLELLQLYQRIQIKAIANMREGSLRTKTETPKQRSLRMKKNRLIRKQKLYGMTSPIEEQESKQSTSNNREEKLYVQKLKNRQAAQKSRQQKKMYVTELQQEIKLLKHQLNILSHCPTCQKQFQTTPPQQPSPTAFQQHQPSTLQQQSEIDYQSQFIRMSSTEQHSSIGIYLFVFMIMLGVFCIGTRMDNGDGVGMQRRDLTQMFNVQERGYDGHMQSGYEYQNNMKSTYSTINQVGIDSPNNYQHGLLSMDQVRSPSAITDQKDFQNIITSFENYKLNSYDEKNLRSKVSLIDANKSLMFCSRPKIYKSNSNTEGVFSSFIDIFVKGAEIMRIFPQSSPDLSHSNSLQLDGLYKITASVEEIEQISNKNFIY